MAPSASVSMAITKDGRRTPTKRSSISSTASTPRSGKRYVSQQMPVEDDLPLPPTDATKQQTPNLDAYFMPLPPSRAASIYSVHRATLSGQLSQLTSTDLPDAESLAAKITNLPTAAAAAKALTNSAQQIKSWIRKAADVLGGLDAKDDVEWAGTGSKDAVGDVDAAIQKFEKLVKTYISAVEDAQKRPDINAVAKSEMVIFLDTLEEVITSWEKVKQSMQTVKTHHELAIEWEELWNTTLGEIGQEIEELGTLVFELEEKRYMGGFDGTASDHVDAHELSTIVEETSLQKPGAESRRQSDMTVDSPLPTPGLHEPEDSGLLTLFARMQPLRASLDFLPMQLSKYESKAGKIFPSACSELHARQSTLESKYSALENDADTLRKELGEDKWVTVFRGASRQATKMCESTEKSIRKVREVLQDESKAANAGLLAKRMSDYEAKKNNYGPAIRKVIAVIEKGVKERATVNGEILRIHENTLRLWNQLEQRIAETDIILDEAQAVRSQQLRDSISTIVSMDMSGIASNVDTPDSSLASSPGIGPIDTASIPTTPELSLPQSQNSSIRSLSSSRTPASRRVTSQPVSATSSIRRTSAHLAPLSRFTASPSPAPRTVGMTPLHTIPSSRTVTPGTATSNKPRWSVGGAVDRKLLDQRTSFTPTAYARRLKEAKPSVYSYRSTSGSTTSSALPSPAPSNTSMASRLRVSSDAVIARAASSLGFHSRRDASPTPSTGAVSTTDTAGDVNSRSRPRSRLYRPSLPALGNTTPSSKRLSWNSGIRSSSSGASMLPLPIHPASPSTNGLTFADIQNLSINGDSNDFEDEEILPSIEYDIASPTPAAGRQRMSIRPSSSLGHSTTGRSNSRPPPVAHTRASLLRASKVAANAGPAVSDKPRWR